MADGRSLIGSGEVDTRPASTRHASAPMDDDDERSPAVALDFGFHFNDHPATLRPEYADCPSVHLVEQPATSGACCFSFGQLVSVRMRARDAAGRVRAPPTPALETLRRPPLEAYTWRGLKRIRPT